VPLPEQFSSHPCGLHPLPEDFSRTSQLLTRDPTISDLYPHFSAFLILLICRNPGLDDQAVFWRVIRRSLDPPINPIGRCRHLESAPEAPDPILGGNHTVLPLSTCDLDLCLFNSGMLSRLYVPEYTYGAHIALHDFFHLSCSSMTLTFLLSNLLRDINGPLRHYE
jgi:hypothetical protein